MPRPHDTTASGLSPVSWQNCAGGAGSVGQDPARPLGAGVKLTFHPWLAPLGKHAAAGRGSADGSVVKPLVKVTPKPKQPPDGQSTSLTAQAQTASSPALFFSVHTS